MSCNDPKPTRETVRARLTVGSYRDSSIMLDGKQIGRFVSYGKGGRRTGNVCSRTAYGSRIYLQGLSIEEEGGSVRVMLDKVAAAVARAMKAGKWEPQQPATVPDHSRQFGACVQTSASS